MATGSSNMTTYKASQVIGNDSAQNPAGALLQSGAGRADDSTTGDTWIFLDTYSGTASPWGIKHSQGDDKIKIIGNNTDGFWVTMNTGDTYILGKVGIGYDPETSGNTYKLYVNGLSYFNNSAYFYDKIGIGYDPETQGNTYKLYVNDSAYFNIGTSDNTSDLKFVINGNSRYLALGGGGIQARTSADAVTTLYLNFNGGQTYVGGNSYLVGNVGIGYDPDTSGNTYKLYVNGTSYFNGSMTSTGDIYIKKSSSHLYLVNTQWTKGTTPSTQTWSAVEFLSNDASNSRIALLETTLDTSGNSQFNIFLVPNVADSTGWSGIVLKKTSAGVLTVSIAGATTVTGDIIASGGYLKSTANSNTVTIGSQNTGATHIYNSANIPFAFNNTVFTTTGDLGSTSYPWNNLYIGKSDGAGIYYVTSNYTKEVIRFLNHSADQYGVGLKICTGGLIIIGAGESGDTIQTNLSPGSGSEALYLASDGSILFYPSNNSYDAAAKIEMTAGRIWAGVNGNTTRENQIGVQSGAGQIYLYSVASTSGNRGLYASAHGSGGAIGIITVNTNNSVAVYSHDTWGGKLRMTDNWLGFYSAALNTGTRYGYIQCNVDRMYFRKENSTANLSYYFDFGSTVQAPKFRAGNDNAIYQTDRCNVYAANGVVGIHSSTNRGLYEFTDGKWIIYLQNSDDTVRSSYKIYGAVWNDFAEMREGDITEGGYAVYDDGHGHMKLCTERLQPGARLTSDTFGIVVGHTETAKTPIGVAGRVLAYPAQDRINYKVGDAVCSAPGGKVDLMTREEIMMYPERILGTVSEIPDYEIWNQRYKVEEEKEYTETNISVNGRIWVYIK